MANQASSQNFNQSTAARNQQIAEANQAQQQPLNILNALRTGAQVSSPQFNAAPQANVAGTNTAQITQNDYNNQLGLYNSQVGSNNQMMGGLFGLGASAITKYSDRRLKTNIERIGTHPLGIGIYSYDYIWGEHDIGVMADEVEKVKPEAVVDGPSGYKMVDYGRLQ